MLTALLNVRCVMAPSWHSMPNKLHHRKGGTRGLLRKGSAGSNARVAPRAPQDRFSRCTVGFNEVARVACTLHVGCGLLQARETVPAVQGNDTRHTPVFCVNYRSFLCLRVSCHVQLFPDMFQLHIFVGFCHHLRDLMHACLTRLVWQRSVGVVLLVAPVARSQYMCSRRRHRFGVALLLCALGWLQ